MKYDIILAGVGGQGILSVAAVIAAAAMGEGLTVRQSEVHGMAQRGGSVQAHLRLADRPISSDLIARADADMVVGMEPLECLRYLDYLKQEGVLLSAAEPYKNIPDYPDERELRGLVDDVPNARLVNTREAAKQAGSLRAANMVLVGAAAVHLPIQRRSIEEAVRKIFKQKGEKVVAINLEALRLGMQG